MAEPQPPNVQEGADAPDVLPANAEDRKAAQALSSLDTRADEESNSAKKGVDLKALNDAMSRLTTAPVKATTEVKKEEPKKLVKVDAADVALLVCRTSSRRIVLTSHRLISWISRKQRQQTY